MKLVKTVAAMDLAAIQRDPHYVLDSTRVHRYRVAIRNGDDLLPVAVSNAGCKVLDGEHRLEACKLEGVTVGAACVYEPESIRRARIFQLTVNKERRTVSAEETAELVQLLAEEEAEKQQAIHEQEAPRNSESALPKKPTRGRKKTPEGRAVDRVAKERGVTPSAVRQQVKKTKKAKDQENTDPVSAELLKPPPTLESRLKKVIAAAKFAHDALTTEATIPDWKQWKLDSLVSSAHHDALALVEKVEKVLWLLEDKKRSIHRADFDATRAGKKVREDEARQKTKEEKAQERTAKKIADREARAMNAALGPDGHVCNGPPCTALGTAPCTKAERIAAGGGLKKPEKALDIDLEQPDGSEVRFVPEQEEVVQAWGEGDALGLGPDGETDSEVDADGY